MGMHVPSPVEEGEPPCPCFVLPSSSRRDLRGEFQRVVVLLPRRTAVAVQLLIYYVLLPNYHRMIAGCVQGSFATMLVQHAHCLGQVIDACT